MALRFCLCGEGFPLLFALPAGFVAWVTLTPLSSTVCPSPHEASRLDPVFVAIPFAGEVAGLTPGPPRVSRVEVRVRELLRK